jgi:hypothetical protein
MGLWENHVPKDITVRTLKLIVTHAHRDTVCRMIILIKLIVISVTSESIKTNLVCPFVKIVPLESITTETP